MFLIHSFTNSSINMAKQDKKIIINQVVLSQVNRQNVDIDKWRSALRSAESITSPKRIELYDLYHDVLLDTHLSSVILKRKTAVLNSQIVFQTDGDPDETIDLQISSPWFTRMISNLIDTIFWGFTVMQFYKEGDWINYDLIPRKHIRPDIGALLKSQTDLTGILYRDGAFPNILEIGQINDLGLLCKAAPWVIYKRNGMGDYAQFAELFGQPIREGIYDSFDDMAREKLKQDMNGMGGSAVFIHPENTQIKLIETTQKSSGSGLYRDMMTFCNAEISKLILGNTLTTEPGDKGARSLGEIHKDVEEQILRQDKKFILDILNYNLSDIFANLGMNTQGGEFIFYEKETIDLKEKALIDLQIASKVPIDDDYWYETYNIPKPENYDELKEEMKASTQPSPPGRGQGEGDPRSKDQDEGAQNKNKFFSFFGEAPR